MATKKHGGIYRGLIQQGLSNFSRQKRLMQTWGNKDQSRKEMIETEMSHRITKLQSEKERAYRHELKERWIRGRNSDGILTTTTTEVIKNFGKMRCFSNNNPSRMAELLLKGLRANIPDDVGKIDTFTSRESKTRHSRPRYAANTALLYRCGLMDAAKGNARQKYNVFRTNFYGYILLEYWAENRKYFKPFLEAYAPENIRRKLLTKAMLAKGEGKVTADESTMGWLER